MSDEQAAAPEGATPDPELEKLRADAAAAPGLRDELAAATADYREAVKAANPDLPEAAFAGDDLAGLKASVSSARAVADHVKRNQVATPSLPAAGAPPPPPAAAPAGAARIEGLRGIDRIREALSRS